MTDDERAVLHLLAGNDVGWCFSFRALARSLPDDWTRDRIRDACRSLRRRGLAEFKRGLMTEDGDLWGSGYGPTEAGKEADRAVGVLHDWWPTCCRCAKDGGIAIVRYGRD